MRIAHVTDFYLPRLGGIETHVAELADLQRSRGHEVHVVTSTPGAVERHVHRVTDTLPRPHALHPLAVREGIRTLRELDVDVVHAHLGVASPLAFFLARAAARGGTATTVTVHSMWAGVAPIMAAMDAAGGWSSLPILWSAVSGAAADTVRRHLPPGRPIRILSNGIDQERWRLPAPAEPSGELVLAAVMRLARRKRPLALLRIVHRAQQELDRLGDPTRLRLLIAGDGPRQQAMASHLRRTRMTEAVSLLGRLDRDEVHRLLGRAQVFVAPADLESFGIAALEARCTGVPVVAKSSGGVREFVRHEREGLLCGSDDEMVAAIVRLAREPALRRRIAEHNRTSDCLVGWGSVLRATEAAYDSALGLQRAAAVRPDRRGPERPIEPVFEGAGS
ncbi:MAG TPA: glycosyltransferase family 4 protein [Intrasporangium sp.]|uniref:glycosyltransferase family 4 protein n=1 Tax=Intrasporangium sp. TaxID=1925024 RepID=UPI002D794AAD|nr:glycosyltransferase family 4 protein [Intrasporangium sp.]HET7397019.1 glycosyltransferase family 4 protein [Intrasporangium sp.]